MKRYTITVNGTPYDVTVTEADANAPAVTAAAPVSAPAAPVATPAAPATGSKKGAVVVSAPMPGNVLDIKVSVGQAVKAGDVLVILEAMKMENDIIAPEDGTVASIDCKKGDVVNVGDVFVTLN